MKIARSTLLCAAATALASAPSALSAALPGGARYAGETDRGGAVTLRLAGDAKRVKRIRIRYSVTCDDGRTGDTYTDVLNAPVGRYHRFRTAGTYRGSGDGSQNRFKVSGRVSARGARGRFSLTATATPAGSAQPVSCRTGGLRWRADRVS